MQAYLLEDRLCFAPDAAPQGGSGCNAGATKYVPLERIPVRARPRGYMPSPGIAPVDPRRALQGYWLGCIDYLSPGAKISR